MGARGGHSLSLDIGSSLSLAKRVRELLPGLPALLAWRVGEGRPPLRRD
ncbi:MAG: hypothetical protein L6R19_21730 [Alphaproteobacteria bacterium]|nr:hypothetical protein [Alphaproteobacteria bacterium]